MRMRSPPFLLLTAWPLWACCQGNGRPGSPNEVVRHAPTLPALEKQPLAAIIDALHLDARSMRLRVVKSERRFEVYVDDSLIKHYPCVLGEKPIGDKFHQGDRKTPEGSFTFRSKRVHRSWHKFIWVDYPNAESYRRYNERKARGSIPAGRDIGGEIGIHGVPDGMDHWIDAGEDWTFGCIAMRNADVDEIYPFVIPGKTTVQIVP